MLFVFKKDNEIIFKCQVSENCYVPRMNEFVELEDKKYFVVSVSTKFVDTFLYNTIKKVSTITFEVK